MTNISSSSSSMASSTSRPYHCFDRPLNTFELRDRGSRRTRNRPRLAVVGVVVVATAVADVAVARPAFVAP